MFIFLHMWDGRKLMVDVEGIVEMHEYRRGDEGFKNLSKGTWISVMGETYLVQETMDEVIGAMGGEGEDE